ncbi:MAG TPA: ATP-binding cassette domain-containing protein, partial [Candidatus Angelobacter sp.]|nr:ATP-binding cassette domain-containing protein [Candidatus Angelobacter sp.]
MTPPSILQLRDVTKRFGGLRAVKNVSLAMNAGEILFIIGPNGAGKTTVFNLISGFLHPNEGVILFQGQDISRTPPHRSARLGIGR